MKQLVTSLFALAFLPFAAWAQLNSPASEGSNSGMPAGYWLQLEEVVSHTGGDLDGMTTYRLYLNTVNETDYLSSCSGDSNNPMIMASSTGTWYNDAANTAWSAQGINPVFYTFFPNLAFDSFLTIGAEDASVPAAQHPSSVWGVTDVTAEFSGGAAGSNVLVDDQVGGAWYLPFPGLGMADQHVGFAGSDLKVLVAQFTTAGTMSGQLQIQVFANGDQGQEFRDLLPFCSGNGECGGCTDESASNYDPGALYDDGTCLYLATGCTDVSACNYDEAATEDDGSCVYPESANVDCDGNCLVGVDALGVCGGECATDADSDGICDDVDSCVGTPEECPNYGCTDATACNFDSTANVDDDSCEFVSCQWCDDPEACNYEGEGFAWTANPDLCTYVAEGECDCDGNVLDAVGICGGECMADEDGDQICDDYDDCVGVYDECGVCNGEGAVYECGCTAVPEGDCDCNGNQLDALGVCGGSCLTDADNDGLCDECATSAPEGYALILEEVTTHTGGDLDGQTTYRVYLQCENATDYLSACTGDDLAPFILESSTGSWFNSPFNTSWNASGINPTFLSQFPEMAYDSYLTIGAEDGSTPGSEHPSTIWGDIDASAEFVSSPGQNLIVNDAIGGAWYTPFPGLGAADTHVGFAGADLRILVMQITTEGTLSGQFQVQVFQEGDQDQEYLALLEIGEGTVAGDCGELDTCFGDLDECGVCEGPGAVFDCGCTVLLEGDCDCDGNELDAVGDCGGNCVEDTDNDGICDVVAEGCTDSAACNYISALVDDGSCIYPELNYDCFGVCLNDEDNDGVCDELEVAGCQDPMACNYNPDATDDDSSCAELDECGECGGTGYLGCTDSDACNYDQDASCDDGSCTFPELHYDCSGACLNDSDGDEVCDELEVVGCQDVAACNYDELATDEGDCEYADEYYDCDSNCLNDADSDGVCDELEVFGCTDVAACNYNSEATEDDGSCAELDDCGECGGQGIAGCTNMEACNYNELATCDDESCTYAEAPYDCDGNCVNDADEDGVCDELEVVGCQDASACNYDELATDEGDCEYAAEYYDCDGNCVNDADEDGVCDELEVVGCQDETACNYDELATDEGDCEYADEYYDCDGNCVNDADEDGVCDELEVPGCTDETACNYNMDATDDDGSCTYPEEEYLDCEGNCLNDADEDGVCDELEVAGCTDEAACNYDDTATDSDDSCEYPGDSCDDGDETTINDAYNADCDCVGEVDGLNDAQPLQWSLYPSPVCDVLTVRLDGGAWGGDVEALILASNGQVIRSERLTGRAQIDVRGLASGMYFLSLRGTEIGASTRRFIVAEGE